MLFSSAVVAVPAEVGPPATVSSVVLCLSGVFINPTRDFIDIACKKTYGCTGGLTPIQNNKFWSGGCTGCPSNQRPLLLGGCLYAQV
ncbi:hypothetical protein FPCIR_14022 [Fusarium pseudocircinatum]|uniref:Uncharacterized protein n=1 Tax=Fusarium pseudocircinatum TaxID=56676 RepID=A0A8H5KHG9_9HYPO|nr:hypothetical protein FPCIR_14022 [Fusarium pseudocircinatum]